MLGRDLRSTSVVLYIDLYLYDLTLTSVYAKCDTIIGIRYASVYVLCVCVSYIDVYHYIDVFDYV